MKEPSITERFAASLRKNMNGEDFAALEACLNCRQCGSACAWHLATGDERLHPKYKKDFIRDVYTKHLRTMGRLGNWTGLVKPLQEDTLRAYMPYFWKCTTCGRCTLACPLGLSTRSIVRLARTAYCDSGLILENPALKDVVEFSRDFRHSFGLPKEKIHLRLGLFLAHDGTDIPIDVHGAEYLYAGTAVENTRFPDYSIKIPKILNAMGTSYTFSSLITDTGTDIEFVAVHKELSRAMLLELEQEAERLGAEKILVSECGCDVRTFYVEAACVLGRPFKFPVQSLDALLLRSIRSGALPVGKVPGPVTVHDSCKITRLSGLGELVREILERTSETVVEMTPNREYNYCCNGGTGPLRLPENTPLRRQISIIKANQIKATRAGRVVTPCSVCMLSLEDICQTYNLVPAGQRMAFLLFEQVYAAMMRAVEKTGETSRTRTPAVFRKRDPAFVWRHGMAGRVEKIFGSPQLPAYLEWLSHDSVVQRYLQAHPEAAIILQAWLRFGTPRLSAHLEWLSHDPAVQRYLQAHPGAEAMVQAWVSHAHAARQEEIKA